MATRTPLGTPSHTIMTMDIAPMDQYYFLPGIGLIWLYMRYGFIWQNEFAIRLICTTANLVEECRCNR